MKSNTNLTATMAARQSGKSALTASISALFEEWDIVDNSTTLKAPREYLNFDSNPLALVCSMIRKGKNECDAGEVLLGFGIRPQLMDTSYGVEQQDEEQAYEILQYFAKKHTMRRLKGDWISKYMKSIDEIVENPLHVDKTYIGILVSLPRIYQQNRSLERVMKSYKSVSNHEDLPCTAMEADLEFVERIHIKAGRLNEYQYFWQTPENYLMRIVVSLDTHGVSAWNTLSSHGKIKITSDPIFTHRIQGYEFNVLQPDLKNTKIKLT